MMTTEHDEALVERVALAIGDAYDRGCSEMPSDLSPLQIARAVIYPPAPPKTRLQVARELLATARFNVGCNPNLILEGRADESSDMQAILAALALPAMED